MFIPAQLNVPAQKGNKTDFFGNPFHSALEFHMAALPHTANQTTFYIQLMYNAPKASLQVHHIFLKYKGLTRGKTLSLFTDGGAMPVTIDHQGPNGAVHVTTIRFS